MAPRFDLLDVRCIWTSGSGTATRRQKMNNLQDTTPGDWAGNCGWVCSGYHGRAYARKRVNWRANDCVDGERWVSLLDWRGFGEQSTHNTKAVFGGGQRQGSGGSGLRGSVAGAEGYFCGGFGVGDGVAVPRSLPGDAVSYGGAGADCDCVVSVSGFCGGAGGQGWRREDGVEGFRGARQREIQYQED